MKNIDARSLSASAHHWARKLQALGHTVRLMAPQFVKPHVKIFKIDAADDLLRVAHTRVPEGLRFEGVLISWIGAV